MPHQNGKQPRQWERSFAGWKLDFLKVISDPHHGFPKSYVGIATWLLNKYSADKRACFPLLSTLASETGNNFRTVQRAVAAFRKLGLLSTRRIGGHRQTMFYVSRGPRG